MDKNLINIDDLVRQRMLGGEEKERAGAWLRMSELLEEEMPQKKPAFIIWRRLFGGMAILLLLGGLSLGGYELNAHRGLGNNAMTSASAPENSAANTANHTNTPIAATNSNNSDNNNNNDITAQKHSNNAIAANTQHKNNQQSGKQLHTGTSVTQSTTGNSYNSLAANTPAHKSTQDGSIAANTNTADNTAPASANPTTANNDRVNTPAQPDGTERNNGVAEKKTTATIASKGSRASDKTTATAGEARKHLHKTVSDNSGEIAKKSSADAEDEGNEVAGAVSPSSKTPSIARTSAATPDKKSHKTSEGRGVEKSLASSAIPSIAETTAATTAVKKSSHKAGENTDVEKSVASSETPSAAKTTATTTTVKKSSHKADGGKSVAKSVASSATPSAAKTIGVATRNEKATTTGSKATGEGNDIASTEKASTHTGKKSANVSKEHMVLSSKTGFTGKPASVKGGNGTAIATTGGKSTHAGHGAATITGSKTIAGSSASTIKHTSSTGKMASKAGNGTSKKPAAHRSKTPTGKDAIALAKDDKATRSGNAAAKQNDTKAGAPDEDKAGATAKLIHDMSAINLQKGKRIIPQLIVHERVSCTNPRQTEIHMDTISFADVTEYYDLPQGVTPEAMKAAKKNGGNELADNHAANDNAEAAPATKPAKSASESESSDAKDNKYIKKTKGQQAMENLSAAFNEIKTKLGRPQFAPGITAGINGTYFGPNSFKGFQFGITGKFMFSDVLILMGEFKYFHRINTGYTLNDDYYNYTPVAGGGYSKELVENPYGISTLHSMELPITIRYCINKFNFFFGGNLVYNFAINTGAYPTTVSPTTPVIVQSMGNDNAPKVKPNDFNSTFGLGYTFGMSYDLSNKVTLDIRDVQTFWNNANTTGAKYISTQLYKSPSFQVSIGYRFGGGKKESKE